MKKIKIIFLFLALFSIGFITGCDSEVPEEPKNETNETPKDETNETPKETVNYSVSFYNSDNTLLETKKVEENTTVSMPNDPVKAGYKFDGWYTDIELTKKFDNSKITSDVKLYAKHVLEQYNITFDTDTVDEYDSKTYTIYDKLSLPIPTKAGQIFSHWADQNNNTYNIIEEGTTGNLNLKAIYRDPMQKAVSFTSTAADKETGVLVEEHDNLFNITAEVRGRIATWTNPEDSTDTITFSKSYKVNTSGYEIIFTAPGDGKLSFYVQNGSSSASTQKVIVACNDGTSETITFSGKDAYAPYPGGSPIVKVTVNVLAGKTYTVKRSSGTIDIFALQLDTSVLEEAITKADVKNTGKTDYIEGEEFDSSLLDLTAVHGDNLYYSDINKDYVFIDSSKIDMTTPGEYDVTAYYGQFSASYKIKVHDVVDTELGFNKTYIAQNSYNEIYINGKVKTIYKLNEELNTDYLTLIVNSTLNEAEKQFIVNENITYSEFDSSTPGKKTITVTYKTNNQEFTTTYDVYVVDTEAYKDSNDNYVVTVDKTYDGVIGAKLDEKGNMFTTISEALAYLESLNLPTDTKKILNISAGHYTEKLEINIPNLTIIGAGTSKATYSKDKQYEPTLYSRATIIEWNSLYGICDEGGFSQNTDSTATVAVRESAINCTIQNLTLSNYWNCEEVFQDNMAYLQEMGIAVNGTVNDHRALALIVQADKFTMNKCALLGYQDTVEFMTGRQFVYNTYIAGNTDFIFGTNATTYFYACDIFVNYKIGGAGYVTAYKGCNQGATDYVQYGFIFDDCRFAADTRVAAGSFALGRPWGKYSNVMIMNSEIGGHISTSSTGRYIAMSGTNPTDETVSYKEYNNTGDSKITSSLSCVEVLSSTAAESYNDISKIYGTTNGLVTYTEAWVPSLYTQINQ